MRIVIEYESSWRNSFLDGSNNESIPKGGRKFIASMTELKKSGNFIQRNITKDTVMGILNRLIGDQRKLYQARSSEDYYFADIDKFLQDDCINDKALVTDEMVYIRNISGSTDQNSFTGMIKSNDYAFSSIFSSELWGILWLNLEHILDFITMPNFKVTCHIPLDPMIVCEQFEQLKAKKPINIDEKIKHALDMLKSIYLDVDYLNAKGQLLLISLYASALYVQIDRLKQKYDLSAILTKNGLLSGISKRGFTKKDFMKRYTTGIKK